MVCRGGWRCGGRACRRECVRRRFGQVVRRNGEEPVRLPTRMCQTEIRASCQAERKGAGAPADENVSDGDLGKLSGGTERSRCACRRECVRRRFGQVVRRNGEEPVRLPTRMCQTEIRASCQAERRGAGAPAGQIAGKGKSQQIACQREVTCFIPMN